MFFVPLGNREVLGTHASLYLYNVLGFMRCLYKTKPFQYQDMQSVGTDLCQVLVISSSDILNLIGAFIDVSDKHRLVILSRIVKQETAHKPWPIVNREGVSSGTVTFL